MVVTVMAVMLVTVRIVKGCRWSLVSLVDVAVAVCFAVAVFTVTIVVNSVIIVVAAAVVHVVVVGFSCFEDVRAATSWNATLAFLLCLAVCFYFER